MKGREVLLGILLLLSVSCLADNMEAEVEPEVEEEDDQGDGKPDLRVTTIPYKPFLMVANKSSEGIVFEGFLVDLIDHISEETGLSYEMHLVADGRYGQRLPTDGDWNGMIGELVDDVADLAVAAITVTELRRTAIDFTEPFMVVQLTALIKGHSHIKSIEDLVNQTDVKYGLINAGGTMDAFRGVPTGIYNKMWAQMSSQDPSVFVSSTEEGVERVQQGDFAFILESPSAEYIVSNHCDLRTTARFNIQNSPFTYAFGMPKNHDYYHEVNDAILKAREDDVLTKLYRKWWDREQCMSHGTPVLHGNGSGVSRISLALIVLYAIYNIS
jgi:ABC-type amino acid transport substrate-binding protein